MKKQLKLDSLSTPGSTIPIPDQYLQGGRPLLAMLDGDSPMNALPLAQYVDQRGQTMVGVNETRKSTSMPNISATAALQMEEASKKLLGMIIEQGGDALGDVARLTHQLVVQYHQRPMIDALWQEVNPNGGVPLAAAVRGAFTFTANGVSDTSSRAIRAQRAIERTQMLANEARVMTSPRRRHRLLAETLQALGTRTPEDFLGTAEEWEQEEEPQLPAGAGAPGMPPPGADGVLPSAGMESAPLPDQVAALNALVAGGLG